MGPGYATLVVGKTHLSNGSASMAGTAANKAWVRVFPPFLAGTEDGGKNLGRIDDQISVDGGATGVVAHEVKALAAALDIIAIGMRRTL